MGPLIRLLFKKNNGSPIRFCLVDLPDNHIEHYTFLIENNGGIVELFAKEDVFKFTLPSHAYDYKIVFDVQFIDDCMKQDKILNISDYFIGDSRLNLGCEFSRIFCGIKSCLLDQITSFKNPFDVSSVYSRRKNALDIKYNEDSDTEDILMKLDQNNPLEPQRKTDTSSLTSLNLESEGSALKSKSPPSKSKKSFFKENELTISKTQIQPVIVLSKVNVLTFRNTKSVVSSTNSDSETPEPSISKLQSLKSKPINQERFNADSETSDDEIPSSLLSFKTPVVKSEPLISNSEIQNSPSKSESFDSKLLLETAVVLNELDESQLIKTKFPSSLKSKRLVSKAESEISEIDSEVESIEPCFSEYDSIDSDSKREESNDKPPTSKPKTKFLRKYSYEKISDEELKEWAKEVTRGRAKDKFGHPIVKSRNFQTWEKRIMVDFLIKAGKIDKASGPNAWILASDLKILPKRRTYSSLMREFVSYIQPNIEEFKLPPHIEAQFIKRRCEPEKPSEKLEAWAMKVSKMRAKDNFGFPIGRTLISTWEKRMMIDFLIVSEKIDKANKQKTWELACHLKIFPKPRTRSILRRAFCEKILPVIESFNLTQNIEAQFLKLRTAGEESLEETSDELKEWAKELIQDMKKSRISLKAWEKKAMVEYLIRTKKIEKAKSYNAWQLACDLKIFPSCRTSYSLRHEFQSKVLPRIEEFNLAPEIEAQFVQLRTVKSSANLEPSEEVKTWAVEVSKNRKKDEFGYPKGSNRKWEPYQPWENKVMLDFVIKMGRIDLAKAPTFWNIAYDLKILPKHRTRFSLAKTFRNKILSNIESYNLQPEIEAQFIRLRTAADMKYISRKNRPNAIAISISS